MTSNDITWGFWRRSSFCAHGDCVLVSRAGRVVNVRDSKEGPGGRIQAWSREEWENLLRQTADRDPWPEGVQSFRDGSVILGLHKHLDDGGLSFAAGEWDAFVKGVNAGEFDFDNLPVWADQSSSGGSGDAGACEGSAPAAAAGTGGDRAVSPVPAAASSGLNVAALHVPAGRVDAGIPVPVPPQASGRPGPTNLERAYETVRRSGAVSSDVATWIVEGLHDAGLLVDEPAVDADELLRRGAEPLVPVTPGDAPPDCNCAACLGQLFGYAFGRRHGES